MTDSSGSINITAVLDTLFHGNQLKRTTRTGWAMRGVPQPEDVAAHSFGVVYTALVLAQFVDVPIDLGQLLAMAALHDLPEGLTTDIPSPVTRFLPPDGKLAIERQAMAEILEETAFRDDFMALWETLHAKETTVARLVDDADKLDLFVQAHVYEQHGHPQLQEFWEIPHQFHFAEAQALYDELRARREHDRNHP